MKIYVAGISGMVGSSVERAVISRGHEAVGFPSTKVNFLDRSKTFESLKDANPDALIIAAAKVGGIGANSKYPVEFLSSNVQIQSNLSSKVIHMLQAKDLKSNTLDLDLS
jgi:GDP-L-fucose synthase